MKNTIAFLIVLCFIYGYSKKCEHVYVKIENLEKRKSLLEFEQNNSYICVKCYDIKYFSFDYFNIDQSNTEVKDKFFIP